ncbi:MAG: thioredoxin-dependent thiol peroxidase [Candidatus Aureabacteria bacterium]|nr:thioredoxin-dependent thiol peroxidase [Candidatus Auribacterota bacterium]
MKIKAGEKAPDFTLPDQDGTQRKLSDYRGEWVLIYFYPKDNTPGCTQEACAIRDNFPFFEKLKAKVLGISVDSIKSHKKFADKHSLPFTLLSDDKKEAVKLYGVWGKKKFMGREFMGTKRTSFLVDPKGLVVRVYESVKPPVHAEEVLEDLKVLMK